MISFIGLIVCYRFGSISFICLVYVMVHKCLHSTSCFSVYFICKVWSRPNALFISCCYLYDLCVSGAMGLLITSIVRHVKLNDEMIDLDIYWVYLCAALEISIGMLCWWWRWSGSLSSPSLPQNTLVDDDDDDWMDCHEIEPYIVVFYFYFCYCSFSCGQWLLAISVRDGWPIHLNLFAQLSLHMSRVRNHE